MSRHVQPAWARAADRRRPAMAAGFFLLAVLHPLPTGPPGAATVDVLVQGDGRRARGGQRPRRGSTFTVRLPLATAHGPSASEPLAPTPERERTDADKQRAPAPKGPRAEDPLVRTS